MNSVESRREEFRKYLEDSGVVDAMTKALIKLYELEEKPECSVRFVRDHMCETCPTEDEYYELKKNYDSLCVETKDLKAKLRSALGNLKRTPSEAEIILNEKFEELTTNEECNSLLKKYLTKDLLEELKTIKTKYGSRLLDCIESGLEQQDAACGVYAADPDCYDDFAALFDPIIEDCHADFTKESNQPECNWGETNPFENLDPENQFIVSTRIRCARSIEGYPFNPKLSEEQYLEIMNTVKDVLEKLDGEFKGQFYQLVDMSDDDIQRLREEHLLFDECDRFKKSARSCRYWPVGRAVFINEDRNFIVWINEEDHLRFISMSPGSDVGPVYQRLIFGVEKIAENISFARHSRLGSLTFCPSNLGTGIRASVLIKLPKLSADYGKIEEICERFNLQIRGTYGENTDIVDGLYDLSNKRMLGLTEFEAIKTMYDGISELIKLEVEGE